MKVLAVVALFCAVGAFATTCDDMVKSFNQQLTQAGCGVQYGCSVTGTCPRPPQGGQCYDPTFGNGDIPTCLHTCVGAETAYNLANPGNTLSGSCSQCNQVPVSGQCLCYACKTYVLSNSNINNVQNGLSECQGTMGQPDIAQCTCNYFDVLDSPRTNYQENCNNCYESGTDAAAIARMKACSCCHKNLAYWAQNKAVSGYGPYDSELTNLSSRCQQWSQQAQQCVQNMRNGGDTSCMTANRQGYQVFAGQVTDKDSTGTYVYGNFVVDPANQASTNCLSFF